MVDDFMEVDDNIINNVVDVVMVGVLEEIYILVKWWYVLIVFFLLGLLVW